MKTDVTKILNKKTDTLESEYGLDLLTVEGAILPEDMTFPSPAKVKVTVKDRNNCMSLVCEVEVPYSTRCDRCLDPIDGVLEFSFEKTVSPGEAPEGYENDPTYDDVAFVSESAIDLDPAILEETVLRLPAYHVCSEDCPGLCQKCGKPLRDGPCGCENKKEIDPRLKKLQKLLDNFD